jgi:hypothetical protein
MDVKKQYVPQSEFSAYLRHIKKQCGSYRAAAKKYRVNSAYFSLALNGKIYPKLVDALNVTFNEPRPRLCIDCPPELIEEFDAARDGRTRAELQRDLLDKWKGVGEVV